MSSALTPDSVSQAVDSDPDSFRDVYVARQPIFDKRLRVYAYELLFRTNVAEFHAPTNDSEATRRVMEAAWLDLGMNTLVGGKRAFINFTRDLLLAGYESGLPERSTVIEVLENIEPDDEVIQACLRLKRARYTIALDDFVYRPGIEPLVEVADVVKIGFGECDPAEQCDHVRRVNRYATLLAEKVETAEDYKKAVSLGFHYFQGWFFCRPETLSGRALTGSRVTYLKLLEAVRHRDLDIEELERVIRSDVSLTHRFLKFLGSAAFGWEGPFKTVRHGLALLGIELTRRWVNLMSLEQMTQGKPQELLMQAAIRARSCEMMTTHVGLAGRESDLFFLGSLSLIDTMLERPMEEILRELPLVEDLSAALLGEQNGLRPVLDLVVAQERGDWDTYATAAATLGVDERVMASLYRDAVVWTGELFRASGRKG